MERRFACMVGDLENGTSMTLKGPHPIAVFRNDDGEFYATADHCTHEKWSLGEDSDLEGNEVTCPLHMARYDIRTGQALCLPAVTGLVTYQVEIDPDGRVYVLCLARRPRLPGRFRSLLPIGHRLVGRAKDMIITGRLLTPQKSDTP